MNCLRQIRFFSALTLLGLLAPLITVNPVVAQTISSRYIIQDLGILGTNPSSAVYANAINERGDVCGVTQIDTGEFVPFRWVNGVMQNLGTFGGTNDRHLGAVDINDLGMVTGSLKTADGKIHAFLYDNTNLIDLGGGGPGFPEEQSHTVASAINNLGEIVGYQSGSVYTPFYYSGGTLYNLQTLLPPQSGWTLFFASGINNIGEIVGTGRDASFPPELRAFRFKVGEGITSVGPDSSPSWTIYGTAINDTGTTTSNATSEPTTRAYRRTATGLNSLPAPAPCFGSTFAGKINSRNVIIGSYYTLTNPGGCPPPLQNRPVIWDSSLQPYEANNLLPSNSGWTIDGVTGINDRGQIVGYGRRVIHGVTYNRAFRLTPVQRQNIADFDGDGRTDASVFREGTWYISPSTAPNTYSGTQWGLPTDRLIPADFDADLKTDIAVWRASGAVGVFYIFESSTSTFRIEQFAGSDDDPSVVGDWDNDGKADLAVYRKGQQPGDQSFFFIRGSSQGPITIQWGIAGDEPLRGDFDGDGKMDAAVYRASDNVWYIRRSSNGQPRYVYSGGPADKRVSGDFDGDGRTDIAIYRDGLWAVLESSIGPRYVYWGLSTDKLVPGDYNGDGRTDFAVWRDGDYWILDSATQQYTYRRFGQAGDIPIASVYIP